MHKSFFLTMLSVALVLCAFSQSNLQKNMLKLNLSGLVESTGHLQYERMVGKKTTIAFGLGIRPKAAMPWPFKGYIESIIDNKRVDIDKFRMSSVLLTPEVRFYFGKGGAFHGFYMAPYARFGFYKMNGPVNYLSSTNIPKTVIFDGSLTTISGGLMIGSSFSLSKRIYLDWWIAGASFGGATTDMRGDTDLSDPDDRDGLKETIDGLNIPLTRINKTIDASGASVTTSGGLIGFRGAGINLGIRF